MYLLLIYSLNFNMVCVCVHVHVHTHGIHVVRGQHKSCFFFLPLWVLGMEVRHCWQVLFTH